MKIHPVGAEFFHVDMFFITYDYIILPLVHIKISSQYVHCE